MSSEMDLIQFDSPAIKKLHRLSTTLRNIPTLNLPGCNPFDDLTEECLCAPKKPSPFTGIFDKDFHTNAEQFKDSDFIDSVNFFNQRESLNLTTRESLGLLNESLLNLVGRDSLMGRESLFTKRESIFGRDSLQSGRESLGILNLNCPNFCLNLLSGMEDANILLDTIKEHADETPSAIPEEQETLDKTGFLQPPSRIKSTSYCSVSSNYSVFERSLCFPNKFNEAFADSAQLNNLLLTQSSCDVPSSINNNNNFNNTDLDDISEFRLRIQSMPLPELKVNDNVEITDDSHVNVKNVVKRRFFSAERVLKSEPFTRNGFQKVLSFEEHCGDSDFNDAVFIEASYLASRISDGSIFEESVKDPNYLLEDTSPPEWNLSDAEDPEEEKASTSKKESIDKLLPVVTDPSGDLKFSRKLQKNTSSSSSKSTPNLSLPSREENLSDRAKNLSDILHLETSKNRSAQELLQNLSEIFSSSNPTEMQKSRGQNLLSSLANILIDGSAGVDCSSSSNNNNNNKESSLEDSGHSSIVPENEKNDEKIECFEVLDLRKETKSDGAPLDLSLKTKSARLSQSGVINKKTTLMTSLSKTKNSSVNSSIGSQNDSKNVSDLKLKVKPSSVANSKRGPLKAVVPIGEMSKTRRSLSVPKNTASGEKVAVKKVTPSKTLQVNGCGNKRTSTPLPEPKLKPMAQSTPEYDRRKTIGTPGKTTPGNKSNNIAASRSNINGSFSNKSNNNNCSNSSFKSGKNQSGSAPDLSHGKDEKVASRRRSVSDSKPENPGFRIRSNSTGKYTEKGVVSALQKARETISNSAYFKSKIGKLNASVTKK